MTTLPTLTKYGGAIPDKSTMDKDTFANAVHPYLNWWNDYIPTLENWSSSVQTLSGEIQTLADDTATARDEAVQAKDITITAKNEAITAKNEAQIIADGITTQLPEGTISDNTIGTTTTWSSNKINEKISESGGIKFFESSLNQYFGGNFRQEQATQELKIKQLDVDKYIVCGTHPTDNKSFVLAIVYYDPENDSFTFSNTHSVLSAGNQNYDGYYFDIEVLDNTRIIVVYKNYLQVFQVNSDDTFTDGTALNISSDHINNNYNIFKIDTDKVLVRHNSDVGIFNINGTDVSASGGATVIESNSSSYNCGDMIQLDTGVFVSYTSNNNNTPYLHGYTFDNDDNVSVVEFTGNATGAINSNFGKLIKISNTSFWLTSITSSYNHSYVMYQYSFDGSTFTNEYKTKYLITNQRDEAGNHLQAINIASNIYLAIVGSSIDYSYKELNICKLNNDATNVKYYGRKDMQHIDKAEVRKAINFFGGIVLSNGKVLRAISKYDGANWGMYFTTLTEV